MGAAARGVTGDKVAHFIVASGRQGSTKGGFDSKVSKLVRNFTGLVAFGAPCYVAKNIIFFLVNQQLLNQLIVFQHIQMSARRWFPAPRREFVIYFDWRSR